MSRTEGIHGILSFPVDPCVTHYRHAGSPKGDVLWQIALCSGLAATPSPGSPGFRTWALQWPALGPTLDHPFGVSKQRPARF